MLIEARGKDAASASWQFAAARMTSADVQLRHQDKKVWSADVLSWKDARDRQSAYTSFLFKEIPDFLKDPPARPEP